jgi:hypothetical protein
MFTALLGPGMPTEVNAQQFYIIGRYFCVNVNDPSRDEGDCNITSRGNSCPEAMSAQRNAVAQVGDPCRQCANVTDNSKKWTGRVDYNQGGPCQGYR